MLSLNVLPFPSTKELKCAEFYSCKEELCSNHPGALSSHCRGGRLKTQGCH